MLSISPVLLAPYFAFNFFIKHIGFNKRSSSVPKHLPVSDSANG